MAKPSDLTPEDLARGAAAMEQVEATQARLGGIVIPVYGEKSNKVPFLSGTAFMLRIEDAVFLITASHTLRIYPTSRLDVAVNREHVGLNANFTRTKVDGAVDLAFARLDERMQELTSSYRVLTMDNIDVTDWPSEHKMYSFVGFPHSLNKVNLKTKTFEPNIQPYTSHKPLLLEDYEKHGLNPCATIAVFFDLSQAEEQGTGRVVVPKAPVGISGGPVWRLGTFQEFHQRTNREKVVGVAVSFELKPDMLLGVRIGVVLEGIRKKHPELSDYLPSNPRCRVTVTLD